MADTNGKRTQKYTECEANKEFDRWSDDDTPQATKCKVDLSNPSQLMGKNGPYNHV